MSKYCPMCNAYTNCTDNCASCLEEEEMETKTNDDEFYEDLLMEQHEQM